MVQSTPLNSFPVFQNSDPVDYGSQMAAVLRDVDSKASPIFPTAAARDIAYSQWVGAGNAMIDGLVCQVGGRLMIYRGGKWRGTTPEDPVYGPATRQLPLRRTDSVEDSIYQGTVADPGYPYRIFAEATARTYADGCECDLRIRAGNGAEDSKLPVITHVANPSNNTTGLDLVTPRRWTGVLEGAARVILYAVRIGNSGSWEVTSASVGYQVEPA